MLQQGQIPKISQEEVLLENEQTQYTLQAVVCPICLTILSLPHWRCQSCDNAVCRQCMEDWWQKQPNSCIFKCPQPQFKTVKRSSTYQAIIDILRVKCRYCQQPTSISMLQSHDKECPKKPISCSFQGCKAIVPRQKMDEHGKNCEFKTQKCQHCQQSQKAHLMEQHKKECPHRPLHCLNQGCQLTLPADQYAKHQQQCPFERVACRWCQASFKKGQIEDHGGICQVKQLTCQWCLKLSIVQQIQGHRLSCPEQLVECALCQQKVRAGDQKDHKLQCMFRQMLIQKTYCQRLADDNVKLKLRVSELEFELEQRAQNQHKLTALSLIKIRQEERKDYEKDLLRIRNSINSIRKCRNQQMSEHLKKLHLSTSLCVFCANIKNKLQDELAPLMRLQDETITKINQLERIEGATKRSVIRE